MLFLLSFALADIPPGEQILERPPPLPPVETPQQSATDSTHAQRYLLGENIGSEVRSAPMGKTLPLTPTATGYVLSGVDLVYELPSCPPSSKFSRWKDECVYSLDFSLRPDGSASFSVGMPLHGFFGNGGQAGTLKELGMTSKNSWREQDSWLCLYSSSSGEGNSTPHCQARSGQQVEEHYLKVTDPGMKAWISLISSLLLIVSGNFLVQRKRLRGLDPLQLFSKLVFSTAYYTTAANSYNLARMQVVLWTNVVLFGFIYVWNTSEMQLALTNDVLILMGIGAGTALGARSADRGAGEERYYLLIPRKPSFRDLVTIGGRADIFKLQMLFFTMISAWMVLKELLYQGSFPSLSAELLSLMGMSSATYLGNEALGGTQTEVMAAMKKLEEAAKAAGIPIDTDPELRALGEMKPEEFQGEAMEKLLAARESLKKLLET